MQNPTSNRVAVRVEQIETCGKDVLAVELRHLGGDQLSPFTAGAHINTYFPNGASASYSLYNSQDDTSRYLIAVKLAPDSRGASRYVHEELAVGQIIEIDPPRNNFPLVEDADDSLFIAGGIGITPILSMLARANALGQRWSLYYRASSAISMPFIDDWTKLASDNRLELSYSPAPRFSVNDIIRGAAIGTHIYCCGPVSMMKEFIEATKDRDPSTVHLEHFAPIEAPSVDGEFEVRFARSNLNIVIRPGETILQAAIAAGLDVPFSCRDGVCGTCETAVLEGVPLHQDMLLSDAEKATNRTMMICCSRSKSPRLVLDM